MINKDCWSSLIFCNCMSIRSGINVINNPKLISVNTFQVSKLQGKNVIGVGVKKF